MSTVIPARFLVRMSYAIPYVASMPQEDEEQLVTLPEAARLDPFAEVDDAPKFADVRLAWNETGLGLTVEVKGKEHPLAGDPERPRVSDGLSLWIDTRDARTGHRATRYCHQFHFLPTGGGADREEPFFTQVKINRALIDAPIVAAGDVPFQVKRRKGGYRLEAFLGLNALQGFDPENNPRLGVFYAVRDFELGEQTLSVSADFPFAEDPSLWSVLELVKPK